MFILKMNRRDDGKGFRDVHELMAYFRKQIYEDFHSAQITLDANILAVFSVFFNEKNPKRTLKNICSGPYSFKSKLIELFGKDVNVWPVKHLKSIPTNFGKLMVWEDVGNGYLEEKRMKWSDFWKKYASKENPIIKPEEIMYYLDD